MVSDDREKRLIESAQQGDRDAFCELAQLHQQRIHTLALHFTGNVHEAEDLSQEAWLRAFREIRRFRGQSSFYTWIRRIAVNTFLDSRKSAFWQRSTPIESVALAYEIPIEKRLLLRQVWTQLDLLSPAERIVVLLRYVEGMAIDEIAATRGTSSGSVKKLLHRAITKLRDKLSSPQARAAVEAVP